MRLSFRFVACVFFWKQCRTYTARLLAGLRGESEQVVVG